MNIIKFKDEIKPGDDIFNEYLKGKYAYCIHMKYVVPFDNVDNDLYIKYEQDITATYVRRTDHVWYDIDSVKDYVDVSATEAVNSIQDLILKNTYTTPKELTMDMVKNFRTWLATELLSFNMETDEQIIHMLEFYKNGMDDDVVKYLELYGRSISFTNIAKTGCNCCNHMSSDLSSLYNTNINLCDCVEVYKTGIHNLMVTTFTDIDFWKKYDEKFIALFKLYVDTIIKLNLPLNKMQLSDFVDCGCLLGAVDNMYIIYLKNLSDALLYIINKDIQKHKLFISDSFNKWADLLYEAMFWI